MPGGSSHTIDVVLAPHVRAHYHVLAHFDLGRNPVGCRNEAYARSWQPRRPADVPSPARSLGELHRAFRRAAGRAALGVLPLVTADDAAYRQLCEHLTTGRFDRVQLPTLAWEAILPLADRAGQALVGLFGTIVDRERARLLDEIYHREWMQEESTARGVGAYLAEKLVPLIARLFREPQRIHVFPCEALYGRARGLCPSPGVHHVATALAPSWKEAFFHTLITVVQQRTDAVIEPHLPPNVLAQPDGLVAYLMRRDAALTTAYHLLLRHQSPLAEDFQAFCLGQFRETGRPPMAAVEALHPMLLLPEDAVPPVRLLLGDASE